MHTRRGLLAALGTAALAGCVTPGEDAESGTTAPTTPTGADHWYPHVQPSGNRRLRGQGRLADATPVDIDVTRPSWLVALPAPDRRGSDWVVAGETTARYRVADGSAERVATGDPLDRVPVVRRTAAGVSPVRPPPQVSPQAPPLYADGGRRRLALGTDGGLLVAGARDRRTDVGALADGRIVRVGADRFALLGDATDRYRHRALGDAIEGGSLLVVDGAGRVRHRTPIGPPAVAEAQGPLAADLDGDGERELLLPVADAADGARIAAFDAAGRRLATGPVHGSGWRHPLAVAPFGPGGEPELAVVRKPHVEHVLEFYRLDGTLRVVATLPGFRSHTYGSRTLDGAVAGDFDGDGATELLVPTTGRERLAAVRREPDGARVAWRLLLPGTLRTNVTGVALEGGLAVGAGTARGVRVWQ